MADANSLYKAHTKEQLLSLAKAIEENEENHEPPMRQSLFRLTDKARRKLAHK